MCKIFIVNHLVSVTGSSKRPTILRISEFNILAFMSRDRRTLSFLLVCLIFPVISYKFSFSSIPSSSEL